jgi:flagellar biosynthesis protein FlhG
MPSDEATPHSPEDEKAIAASNRGEALPRSPIDRPIQVIAIAGAKGGVGKTLVASNLALYLATIGRRVVLVDADAAGGSAHTLLGVPPPVPLRPFVPPQPELRRVSIPERPELDMPFESELPEAEGETTIRSRTTVPPPPVFVDAPIETSIPNLRVLHAGLDQRVMGQGRVLSRAGLLTRVRALTADYAVVDLGSGTEESLLDFYEDADINLFLVTPEPTALEQTYRFIRELFQRRVRRRVGEGGWPRFEDVIRRLGNAPPPLDLLAFLESEDDEMQGVVRDEMASFRFRIAINQARLRTDLEIGAHIRSAVLRRFGVRVDYLGYVDFDDTAWTCVRTRRPLLIESPGTKASRSLEKIARRLLAADAGKTTERPLRTAPPHTHHDLLEIERGATDEDIRRAYKRAKEIFGPQSMVIYGLFESEGIDALRARLDEAYDVLLDPARRRPYELSVFPVEAPPVPEVEEDESSEERPPAPPISPDTEFTGALLHAVRVSQGVELREISQATKIGVYYLRYIEADEFSALPAPVYVRGFVTELAKFLKLDHEQVARTYLARYRRYLEERGEI